MFQSGTLEQRTVGTAKDTSIIHLILNVQAVAGLYADVVPVVVVIVGK